VIGALDRIVDHAALRQGHATVGTQVAKGEGVTCLRPAQQNRLAEYLLLPDLARLERVRVHGEVPQVSQMVPGGCFLNLCHGLDLGLARANLYQNDRVNVDIQTRPTSEGPVMTCPDFETLRLAVASRVATVTMNRPEVRNALNAQAYAELEAAFRLIQADGDISVVVLTGADPAFCSGEDVKQMMAGPQRSESQARLAAVRPRLTPAAAAIHECDRPIIAAVNGAAVGWGMELSLLADIRLASERARFGEIFVKRGLVTDAPGMMILPRLVGPQRASELLFTGDIIDAQTALSWGLVSRVVEHEKLLGEAQALAGRIADNAPLALRYMKEGLRRASASDLHEFGGWVSGTLGRLFQTEDHKEGVASFLEKRAPRFQGR